MTKIECTECHDIIETSARTVELPFICDDCKKAPELLAAMAPTPAFCPCANPGCDDCNDKALVISEADNIPCDTATIENTNLLIADLEQQLEAVKNFSHAQSEVIQQDTELIEQLRNDQQTILHGNKIKQEIIDRLERFLTNRVAQLIQQREDIRRLRAAVVDLAIDNSMLQRGVELRDKAGRELTEEFNELVRKYRLLEKKCEYITRRRDYWRGTVQKVASVVNEA